MELEELLMKKLMNKKVYHPVYGEIGEIKDILRDADNKYVVFRERSVENLTEEQDVLRAIPVKRFYLHDKTSELRVDFDPQWISEAPKFTADDLENHDHQVLNVLNEYYRFNDSVRTDRVAVKSQK